MYCEKCGAEIKAGELFCTKCGTKVNIKPEEPKQVAKQEKEKKQKGHPQKGNKKKWFVLGGIAVAVLVVGIVLLLLPKRKSIKHIEVSLDDYIEVSFEGYDGIGTAQVRFKADEFLMDYGDQVDYVNKDKVEVMEQIYSSPIQALYIELDGELSESEYLKNNQKITYHWNIDQDKIAEVFNCDLIYSDQEFIVEGLEQPEEYDPFFAVNAWAHGINGSAELYVEMNSDYVDDTDIYYDWEKRYDVKNGDVITVNLRCDGVDDLQTYFMEKRHKKLTALSKEFTIEGLPTVVTDISQIKDSVLDDMKKRVEQSIEGLSYNEHHVLQGIKYSGYSFGLYKDGFAGVRNANYLYLVYKVNVSYEYPDYELSQPFTYYYVQKFSGLTADETGYCSEYDSDSYEQEYEEFDNEVKYGDGFFDYDIYTYEGYRTIDEFLNTKINTYDNEYDYDNETKVTE